MDFINLTKKIFSARPDGFKELPLLAFAGKGLLGVTDKKIIAYKKYEKASYDACLVAMPNNLCDVADFDADNKVFVDPDGEPVDGFFVHEEGSEEFMRLTGVVDSLLDMILNKSERQVLPDKLLSTVLSSSFSIIGQDEGILCKSSSAKKYTHIKNFDFSSRYNGKESEAVGTLIPLKFLDKLRPSPLFVYSKVMRAIHAVFEDSEGIEYGAFITFKYNKEFEKEKDKGENMSDIKNVVSKEEPLKQPAGLVIEEVGTEPAVEEVESAEVAVVTDVAPIDIKPPVTDVPKAEDIKIEAGEEPAATAQENTETVPPAVDQPTDESRLEEMMEVFRDGKISVMRNDIIFLERLVKLQAKLLKKGATGEADKKKMAAMRDELNELKKENRDLKAARKKMLDALGISV